MNSGAKTLIILSPGFPANEGDSTCIPPQQVFVKNLKLIFPGLNIIVLAFEYPFFSLPYQWNNITVIPFGGRNRAKLFRLRNWVSIRATLTRLNKQNHLLGLLSFWMGDRAFIGNAFAKKHNLPHFCWLLGQDARPGNKYFRLTKPESRSLIALSDFIAGEFIKNYGISPAHIIPVGIDPGMFNTPPHVRDIDILGAGSLIPLKQFSKLINLVKNLHSAFPGIKAVICGNGPEQQLLENMISEHHLENNVELVGELPHEHVLGLMQRAKIFVHPSSYEGLGVVCLEALHAGAQVVSFVRPMNAEIKNWHVAHAQGDMLNIVKALLQNPALDHTPVTPYLVADACKAMMKLFGYKEFATS